METPDQDAPMAQPSADAYQRDLDHRIKSGASWFYWIGAFSVINSVLVYANAPVQFALGLAVTVMRDDTARQMGGPSMTKHIAIDVLLAAFIAAFGYFAGKRHGWAFIVGMILLGLDTALTGLLSMWLNLALHAWAMISIVLGYRACRAARG